MECSGHQSISHERPAFHSEQAIAEYIWNGFIEENLNVFDFELTDAETDKIAKLNTDETIVDLEDPEFVERLFGCISLIPDK